MIGKLIALFVLVVFVLVAYHVYSSCKSGKGGILSHLCHWFL